MRFTGVGLGDQLGNLTFYVSQQSTRSSFSRVKASKRGLIKITREIPVTVVPCEALLYALPRRVHFAKIDIEELERRVPRGSKGVDRALAGWTTPASRELLDGYLPPRGQST